MEGDQRQASTALLPLKRLYSPTRLYGVMTQLTAI